MEEASDPSANNFWEITRMKGGKLLKELKQVKLGNVKQLLQRVKLSVPLTKLL